MQVEVQGVALCTLLLTCVSAIGPAASLIAEGGGGDECTPSTLKGTPSKSLTCRCSGADKMLDFMKTFVSLCSEAKVGTTHMNRMSQPLFVAFAFFS